MKCHFLVSAYLCFAVSLPGQTQVDRLLDRIVAQEHELLTMLGQQSPIVETYIQVQDTGDAAGANSFSPISKDLYFLGRMNLTGDVTYQPLIDQEETKRSSRLPWKWEIGKSKELVFLPRGFAQMAVIDAQTFDRKTYQFEYVRREFLGEVRCLVFDVAPLDRSVRGKFVGRIWVEDADFHVVRFNGIYTDPLNERPRSASPEQYFHFDSWRTNVSPGVWMPAQIYVEESDLSAASGKSKAAKVPFKAQTRLWGYDVGATPKLDELTNILLDKDSGVADRSAGKDLSPLESQRSWERQAEENIIDRLERGGLLAPPGPVDDVLNTVINNLMVMNKLNLDVKCRLLLTTPLETFSIGQTIVVSRGLVDVLPDESSLAVVLAGELAHIALGHRTNTQFAFHNQTMGSDGEILRRFRFARSEIETEAASKKSVELIRNSPYQKLGNAGLFLKALGARGPSLPHLIHANFGNRLTGDASLGLAEFVNQAPPLEEEKLEQIAALPLGSRIKLNPWNNSVILLASKPTALLAAREKMPFEVTPFQLHLTRVDEAAKPDVAQKTAKN
ncbi:MAG: M48 family metalloprotease [Bryobacteraceae bacterium]